MSKALKTALALAAIAGTAGMAHAATTKVWVDNPYIAGLRPGNYFTQIQVQAISGTTAAQTFCVSEGIKPGAVLNGNAKVNTVLAIKGTAVTTGTAPNLTVTTTYNTTPKASKESLIASYVQNTAIGVLAIPITCALPPLPVGEALTGGTNVSYTGAKAPTGFATYVPPSPGSSVASPVESSGMTTAGTYAGKTTCTGELPANVSGTAFTPPMTVFGISQNPKAPLTGNFTISNDSNFGVLTQNVLFALPAATLGAGGTLTYKLTNACDATIGVVFNRIGHN